MHDLIFKDIAYVHCITNNVRINLKTLMEHDHVLHVVLKACQSTEILLNACRIQRSFFGNIPGGDTHYPYPAKVMAIHQIKMPKKVRMLDATTLC